MSKDIVMEEVKPQIPEKDDPLEVEEIDLTSLLESLSLLTHSSSQLHSEDKTNPLKQLLKLSPAHLEKNSEAIDFPSWTDDIATDLLNELADSVVVPTSTTVYLLQKAIYPKITLLQTSIPRLMMNNTLQLAKKEGKCVLDGLILPLLFCCDIARPQLEVITKVIGESLNPTQRFYLFECILDDGESIAYKNRKYLRPWNDTIFQLMNSILSTQPYFSLTKPLLFDLLRSLQTVVQSNPKDKGSMQLLLLLTSKHSQSLVDHQAIGLVEEICHTSTMFLKRAVAGQIASLKKRG